MLSLPVAQAFFDYHLHQIAYDPATGTASYYFDGALIKSG